MKISRNNALIASGSLLCLVGVGCVSTISWTQFYESPHVYASKQDTPCSNFYQHVCGGVSDKLQTSFNRQYVSAMDENIWNEKYRRTEKFIAKLYNTYNTKDPELAPFVRHRLACESEKSLPYEVADDTRKNIKAIWNSVQPDQRRTLLLQHAFQGKLMNGGVRSDAFEKGKQVLVVSPSIYHWFVNNSKGTAARFYTEVFSEMGYNRPSERVQYLLKFYESLVKEELERDEIRAGFSNKDNYYTLAEFGKKFDPIILEKFYSSNNLENKILVVQSKLMSKFTSMISSANDFELETLFVFGQMLSATDYYRAGSEQLKEKFKNFSSSSSSAPQDHGCFADARGYNDNLYNYLIIREWISADKFAKERVKGATEVFEKIRAQALAKVRSSQYFSPESRDAIVDKLLKMKAYIGYAPNLNEMLTGFDFANTSTTLPGIRRDQTKIALLALAQELKKNETNPWQEFDPTEVNAYYMPDKNVINIPFAYLQFPNFDPNGPAEKNYAILGTTLGHEISHAFDTNGVKHDSNGLPANLLTQNDMNLYFTRTNALEPYYRATRKKWDLMSGENVADMLGLQLAHEAFFNGRSYDPAVEKSFFYSYGASHCEKRTAKWEQDMRNYDPHAPGYARLNATVMNQPEFKKAFSCSVQSPMYVEDSNIIKIW